jgi:hypothetical protein
MTDLPLRAQTGYVPMANLTQLPNGDLWRGAVIDDPRPDTVDNTAAPSSIDSVADAVNAVIASAKGSENCTCFWCGTQFGVKERNELSAHIAKNHQTAIKPIGDIAALSALVNAEPTK